MKNHCLYFFVVCCAAICTSSCSLDTSVNSPSGALVANLRIDDSSRLYYEVSLNGQNVTGASRLGITIDGNDLGTGAEIHSVERSLHNETYATTGFHARAVNNYNNAIFHLRNKRANTDFLVEL